MIKKNAIIITLGEAYMYKKQQKKLTPGAVQHHTVYALASKDGGSFIFYAGFWLSRQKITKHLSARLTGFCGCFI
jgi:hypothetical protein